ncbi:alpha/beta hydrolase [Sphingomonas sp. MMS24-JH45]
MRHRSAFATETHDALRHSLDRVVDAAAGLERVYAFLQKHRQTPSPAPVTQADWDRRNGELEALIGPMARATADALGVTSIRETIGGVPVLRLVPKDAKGGSRALVYVHGGGYVYFSAETTLTAPALVAAASGDKVISVDYMVAPRGDWRSASAQVLSVYRTLLKQYDASAIGLFGNSAGGGLSAGSVLRMRDKALPLPGALYLISPWMDVTGAGCAGRRWPLPIRRWSLPS